MLHKCGAGQVVVLSCSNSAEADPDRESPEPKQSTEEQAEEQRSSANINTVRRIQE
jgi:hypothetical protein